MMEIPFQEINTRLFELRSEQFAFETSNSSDTELVHIWNSAWFNAIKNVSEYFFKNLIPAFSETLSRFPDYFREILIIEVSQDFLKGFYQQLLPFLVDDLNILRAIVNKVKDSYCVSLETGCVDCRIFVNVAFDYEFCGLQKYAQVDAKISIWLVEDKG